MSRRTIVACFVCIMIWWISSFSHAAEISCDENNCSLGILRGPISKGDYEKVATLLRTNYLVLRMFSLASPGGDVNEALKIGRLFRKYLITTITPTEDAPVCRGQKYCSCASACALIWFGGVRRIGSVGLHRPRINDPMFAGLSPDDASIAYRRALEKIMTYLDEMEVPKSMIELMVATGSGDIRWVQSNPNGDGDSPPSIAEWIVASCGSVERVACKIFLLDDHRKRLAPP
jgi:hypothetical protein